LILEYHALPHCEHRPVRANPSDAGLDLRFNPVNGGTHILAAGESAILPTGLKFGVPHGYMIQIMNRSGNAAKKQLMVGACVVDSGYNGEVFVNLHNIGPKPQTIEAGMKIAQAVVIPALPVRFLETRNDNLYDWWPITISGRGDGALGSTGE
jgi:dUTP pyrophosphatase